MPDIMLSPAMGSTNQMFDELYRDFVNDRTLFFNQEVDDNVVEDFIMYIIRWNKEDMHVPVENRAPIKIYISSCGGNVFSSNILSDVIEQSKTPVIGIGMDTICSAAYHVYLSCHKRYAFQNSAFLQHDGEVSISNSGKKAKDTMQFFDQMDERSKKHVLNHTLMTSDFYDSIYETEYWMYADKAKELGVVHKIIGEDCDLEEVL